MMVSTNRPITTELHIFHLFNHLHRTADRDDGLLAWFLRLTAPVYSGVISHLINQSLLLQRKTAIQSPRSTNPRHQRTTTGLSPFRQFYLVCWRESWSTCTCMHHL